MKESTKALLLLKPLFKGLAKDRGDTFDIWIERDNQHDEEWIVTQINDGVYKVNVTAENMRSMIKSVVDAVALKF